MPTINVRFPSAAACHGFSAAFYARVEQDPLLHPFLPESLPCAVEGFAAFLARFLGEPRNPSDPEWLLSPGEARERLLIGHCDREAWLRNIGMALDDRNVEEPVRGCLVRLFAVLSLHIVRGTAMTDAGQSEIAELLAEQRLTEELVNAVQTLDVRKALELAGHPVVVRSFSRHPENLLCLLAMMCGGGNPNLLDFVRGQLLTNPQLATDQYMDGHTLLHGAAEGGCIEIVKILLRYGAGVNEADRSLHNAVFCCANVCGAPGGPEVIRTLVRAGGRIDLADSMERCTPLHGAARQGNVGIGEALIECGAKLEARDARGDTPLRRAVDSGKVQMAGMLAGRGADVYSIGNGGLTALEAAKSPRMQRVLVDSTLQGLIALSRHVRSGDRAGTLHGGLAPQRQFRRRMPGFRAPRNI
jgi:truncated hemoglobin YjbI